MNSMVSLDEVLISEVFLPKYSACGTRTCALDCPSQPPSGILAGRVLCFFLCQRRSGLSSFLQCTALCFCCRMFGFSSSCTSLPAGFISLFDGPKPRILFIPRRPGSCGCVSYITSRAQDSSKIGSSSGKRSSPRFLLSGMYDVPISGRTNVVLCVCCPLDSVFSSSAALFARELS